MALLIGLIGESERKDFTDVTDEEFAQRVAAMTQTLDRVTCFQLPQRADREDAVQETIRKAWEKRDALRDERLLQTWIIRILLNECHDIRARISRSLPTEELPDLLTPPPEHNALTDALARLDDMHRMPILLHYIEGYSIEEVGQMLQIPVGTVKSRLARGRTRLRALLDEEVFE